MSSVNDIIAQINSAATTTILVLGFTNFLLGAIGLVFNLIIFTRPSLNREPCSVYFFWSTCFSLFVVYIIVPLRILSNNFNIDMTNSNLGICKIEYFANYSSRAIPCWLILLACLDRYFHSSSNVNIRRLSSLKVARWSIPILSLIILILYSHMLVYYEIYYTTNQSGNIIGTCTPQKGIYRAFIGFWYMILYSLCPSLLMLLFGLLTLNNIRQHRRVVPTISRNNQILRRTDNQLLRMLIAQVLVIMIATLPYSINQLYSSFTVNITKSTLRIAQESFATRVLGSLTSFAHTTSFYLYTLTGTIFRKEFHKIIQRCFHKNQNREPSLHRETNAIGNIHSNRKLLISHINYPSKQ
ncbi:unnamed protein product [Adineta steineri]|uniref:G-protein coupled receptors family 1 profile domain-containing protein n=1 Tax=Adineta steineri TaxID=433720 RepID=A0A818GNS4_9BILA|nr:unnamed protein product [Adineta steineri]